ncbi:hypothetical protein CPC08DRAFT_252503 [Agrocybe pediades]|nr:hypothetical protein CPC08DRAFT_252503 [Agrocybe pediades]
MVWLSRCPEWQRSREFETTTRSSLPGGNSLNKLYGVGGSEEDKDWDLWEAAEVNTNGSSNIWSNADGSDERLKTRVVFQPTCDTTHTIFYRGHWLRVKRKKKLDDLGLEILSISVVAWSNAILKQLVLQAKREYKAEAIHRIQIYLADAHVRLQPYSIVYPIHTVITVAIYVYVYKFPGISRSQ